MYWDLGLKILYKLRCRGIQQKLLPAKHTLTIPQYISRVPLGSRTSIMFNLYDKNSINTVKTND